MKRENKEKKVQAKTAPRPKIRGGYTKPSFRVARGKKELEIKGRPRAVRVHRSGPLTIEFEIKGSDKNFQTIPYSGPEGKPTYGTMKRALHNAGYLCRSRDIVIGSSHRDRLFDERKHRPRKQAENQQGGA